jgi:hypothetical protein
MTARLHDRVSVTSTEYGLVLLDEDAGEYWNLNASGALVVRAVLAGATADEAARALAEEHPVDLQTARTDVHELLSQLRDAGLIDDGRVAA